MPSSGAPTPLNKRKTRRRRTRGAVISRSPRTNRNRQNTSQPGRGHQPPAAWAFDFSRRRYEAGSRAVRGEPAGLLDPPVHAISQIAHVTRHLPVRARQSNTFRPEQLRQPAERHGGQCFPPGRIAVPDRELAQLAPGLVGEGAQRSPCGPAVPGLPPVIGHSRRWPAGWKGVKEQTPSARRHRRQVGHLARRSGYSQQPACANRPASIRTGQCCRCRWMKQENVRHAQSSGRGLSPVRRG